MRPLTTLILLALLLASGAGADTDDAVARSERFTIDSRTLGEIRELLVRRPPGYTPDHSYPVVYVLDGEWNFELVAAYLDYMADNSIFPPMIVTAVTNVNRNRDYVPRPDPYFSDTGKADSFLAFVEKDWQQTINKRFPTSGDNIIVGHSFGGVFTLHSLFSGRDLFDAYIALGSSAWIADRVLFEEAEAWFKASPAADSFVYMAVGEGDGGPTLPSSEALAERFAARAPAGLEWYFEITPRTDHFKNVVSGMNEGFMKLFPAWGFVAEVETAAASGAKAVDQWFRTREAELGYRFLPAWFDMGVAATGLAQAGNTDAAIAILRNLRRHQPDNAHVASFASGVYRIAGETDNAIAETRRAIALAEAQGLHPNAMHLDRLRQRLAVLESAE